MLKLDVKTMLKYTELNWLFIIILLYIFFINTINGVKISRRSIYKRHCLIGHRMAYSLSSEQAWLLT